MGPETHFTISVATALGLAAVIWRGSAQMASLSTKMDVVWDHLIRRGQAEGVTVGALVKNSPVYLTQEGRDWFAGELGTLLKAWYTLKGKALSERELYAELEKEFGDRIVKEVCIPRAVHAGACLAAAALFCRED